MSKKIFVLGGWGIKPEILKPCFSEGAAYIDVNAVLPQVILHGTLVPEWKSKLYNLLFSGTPQGEITLAGWSTGAIVAYALADMVKPKRMVLLSATPSFCIRPGFPFGQKPASLRRMQAALRKDRLKTVRDFIGQCGLSPDTDMTSNASPEELLAGLQFLDQANLLPPDKAACETLLFHGTDDVIVPCGAGNYFSQHCGGRFYSFPGGHVFFLEDFRKIAQLVAGS
jgi:surfactin synthase thioesterase subunit